MQNSQCHGIRIRLEASSQKSVTGLSDDDCVSTLSHVVHPLYKRQNQNDDKGEKESRRLVIAVAG